MLVLGINSYFEHPAVAAIVDGRVVFAIEEERLNRIKGGKRYSPFSATTPFRSIHAALAHVGATIDDVDAFALSYDKWAHFASIFSRRRRYSFTTEVRAFFAAHDGEKALATDFEVLPWMLDRIPLDRSKKVPVVRVNHHLSHAASAYFCSGFDRSLVLTVDGCGESITTQLYVGEGREIMPFLTFRMPDSLGFLYTYVTEHLGFAAFKDESKVMGLAAFGEESLHDEFAQLIRYEADGQFRLNKRNLLHRLQEVLGPARMPWEPLEQRHKDMARTVQATLERVLLALLAHHGARLGLRKLCMAGGVAMNCVANGKIAAAGIFDDVFIQPASDDSGTAVGAAVVVANNLVDSDPDFMLADAYLGTQITASEVRAHLGRAGVPYRALDDHLLAQECAARIASGQIGGVFRGRMEFGPRALGNRSILADPRSASITATLNELKGREWFRPYAPVVQEEHFDRYFEGKKNPFMLLTSPVTARGAREIPGAVHVDGTSRAQAVNRQTNAFLCSVLDAFGALTSVPVLINTSLNTRGLPIVERLEHAISILFNSPLDFLIMEDCIVEKTPPPA